MTLEEVVADLRQRRIRINDARHGEHSDADILGLIVDEAIYDSRLVHLALMLDVPVPLARPGNRGLYADDRYLLEDRIAEAGVELRRRSR